MVERREHQNAEQRAHEAPAERVHAEDANADRDDELAERGVRVFVWLESQNVLVGGAGVVDFVEIGGVHVAWVERDGVLLIRELTRVSGDGGERCKAGAVCLFERELVDGEVIAHRCDADIFAGGGDGDVFPRIDAAVRVFGGGRPVGLIV